MEMTKYQMGLGVKKITPFIPASTQRMVNNDEENWELEATIKTSYDPRKKASQLPVLRKLEGATPSQRKEFRAMEKVRLEDLESGGVERMTGLRRPQLGGGVLAPSAGSAERERMKGVNTGGLVERGRFVTVGRGERESGVKNGEVSLGRGRGVLGSGEGGSSHVVGVGRGSDHAGNDDGEKDAFGQEEVVKVGRGRGRVVWGR